MGTHIEDRYLGDGVYATFYESHLVLDVRGQDSTTGIALNPDVFSRLLMFKLEVDGHLSGNGARAPKPVAAGGPDD